MSPEHRSLLGIVSTVRRRLERRAMLAAALWMGVATGALLLVAWVLAGPEGWRQGSDGPAALDTVLLLCLGAAAWLLRRGLAKWFAEPPLTESIEGAVGVRSGRVRGSLELARALPEGVSSTLADLAVRRTIGHLGRPPDELAGELGERVDLWTRRGMGWGAAWPWC